METQASNLNSNPAEARINEILEKISRCIVEPTNIRIMQKEHIMQQIQQKMWKRANYYLCIGGDVNWEALEKAFIKEAHTHTGMEITLYFQQN